MESKDGGDLGFIEFSQAYWNASEAREGRRVRHPNPKISDIEVSVTGRKGIG